MLTLLIQMPSKSDAAALQYAPTAAATTAPPKFALTAAEAAAAPNALDALAPATHSSSQRPRFKRLRKRHNDDLYLATLSAASDATRQLEWHNPCRGRYEPNDKSAPHLHKQSRSHHLKQLRRALRLEYKTLKLTLHEIKIDDMKTWRKHATKYRFLPGLSRTTKFKPMHWHRGMQHYVAAFVFLGTEQYRWDQRKHQSAGRISRELNSLLLSARRILCEIETAYNGTSPHRTLPSVSGKSMQHKLKFYSKDAQRVAAKGVDAIDLKYAKMYYLRYLKQMWEQLNSRQKSAKLSMEVDSGSSSSSSGRSSSSSSSSNRSSSVSGEIGAASAALPDESFNVSGSWPESSESAENLSTAAVAASAQT